MGSDSILLNFLPTLLTKSAPFGGDSIFRNGAPYGNRTRFLKARSGGHDAGLLQNSRKLLPMCSLPFTRPT
jgi:hypothetical protein